jgi:MoxR-like ATPase
MRAISDGDKSDLSPMIMDVPRERIHVDFPGPLSRQFEEYVRRRLMTHTLLRVFQRLRTLAMGCAVLDGRDVVHARDVEKVAAYDPYWSRMIRG